jgi:hypothetical protein
MASVTLLSRTLRNSQTRTGKAVFIAGAAGPRRNILGKNNQRMARLADPYARHLAVCGAASGPRWGGINKVTKMASEMCLFTLITPSPCVVRRVCSSLEREEGSI